jgi:hypothetical protein
MELKKVWKFNSLVREKLAKYQNLLFKNKKVIKKIYNKDKKEIQGNMLLHLLENQNKLIN